MVGEHSLSSASVLSQVSPTGTTALYKGIITSVSVCHILCVCVTRVLQVIPTMILLAIPHGSLLPGLHVR